MKIYVASSWRNESQPGVVARLRAEGHEVYDFRNPESGNNGFGWRQLGMGDSKEWTPAQLRLALEHPIAADAFRLDSGALKWCDACVLVFPCGNDAHLEAGWAAGAGKLLIALFGEKADPGLMIKFAQHIALTLDEVCGLLTAYDV